MPPPSPHGPVPDAYGATKQQATRNMAVFIKDLAEDGVAVVSFAPAATSYRGEGRWAYVILTDDERRLEIRMPGHPLGEVRGGWTTIHVDGRPWYWDTALEKCRLPD
ncbi:hypothetical protein AB0K49_29665 [Streptomyces decoyicus]|uniref:hypothetical protein n=1 Tax=Streptomyces decoyicus TaxID=249567 RepID=UPI00345D3438